MSAPVSVEIRTALVADAPAIAQVHCAAALAGYVDIFPKDTPKPTPSSLEEGWLRLISDPNADVRVATLQENLVGSVALAPNEDVPSRLLLTRLYVHPAHWDLGIGSALHDDALTQAEVRGAERLNLWVLERNSRARQMYERRRWRLIPGHLLPNNPPSIVDVLYERLVG